MSPALLVHAVCVAATQRPHTSPLPASHVRLSTRQDASAFNQPLSFDTSKVTDMRYMFMVRSARALTPTALSRALLVHANCVATNQRPHVFRAAPLPASHARLATRQEASAFNQPLSFDTSKVTDMRYMFAVRSARALLPTALSRAIPVDMPIASPPPHALTLLGRTFSHIAARLSTRQSATAFNQPLSFDTSKVTTMRSMFAVRSARALPPLSLDSGPPRACRLRRRHPAPSRLPGRTSSHTARPPFDSAVRVGVQPSAELRHVQRHEHVPHVLRALRACPAPQQP